jgi:hypothetical protein
VLAGFHLKQADGNLLASSHRKMLWQNVKKPILVSVEHFSRQKVSIDRKALRLNLSIAEELFLRTKATSIMRTPASSRREKL